MSYKNILIIKVRAMGDTLLATPTIAALRQAYPEAKMSVMVSPEGRAIIENHPHINQLMVYDKTMNGLTYLRFVRQLRKQKFDLVIALHASFRTALLARLTGAAARVVNNHSGNNYFGTIPIKAKKEAKSTIRRDLDTIHALGLNAEATLPIIIIHNSNYEEIDNFLKTQKIDKTKKIMILAPGAGKQRKRWSDKEVCSLLEMADKQSPAQWILLTGPEESMLAKAVRKTVGDKVHIFQGSIKAAAALISRSDGMITTDSGPKHIACAVGTRTLTLWTDEPIAEWHPYDRNIHELIVSSTGLVVDIEAKEVWERAKEHFSWL